MRPATDERAPRAFCYGCHKVATLCICAQLQGLSTRTGITIVQHPRERFHPLGTARIARLGLARLDVHVAWHERRIPELPADAALLYPAEDALDLETLSAAERPSHLVVLDGTWHHAHVMYRELAWLRQLRCVRLNPKEPSRYRIRREPQAHCISTIEAIVQALLALEPERAELTRLLSAFDTMIDSHLQASASSAQQQRLKRPRCSPGRAIPAALLGSNVVVVYGESMPLGAMPNRKSSVDANVVHWVAEHVASGRLYERLLAPAKEQLLPAARLRHMRLEAEMLQGDRAEFPASFGEFAGKDPLIVAWNQSTLDLLDDAWHPNYARHLLKSVYCNLRPGPPGTLEAVIERESLNPVPRALKGRAAQRLANAVAVTHHFRASADSHPQAHPQYL